MVLSDVMITRATSSENMPSNMRKMHSFRSSCACAKYHPGLSSQFIHSVISNDSVSGQWSPWSDCADMPKDTFSHGETRFMFRRIFFFYEEGIRWRRYVSVIGCASIIDIVFFKRINISPHASLELSLQYLLISHLALLCNRHHHTKQRKVSKYRCHFAIKYFLRNSQGVIALYA